MNNKEILVILLVAIALGLAYYYLFLIPAPNGNGGETNGSNESEPTTKDVFLDNLLNSPHVYIVMDVRNAEDMNISNGILQCGVDFSGSQGLVDKNKTFIAIDNATCTVALSNGTSDIMSVEECLALAEEGPTLYVSAGEYSEYFENKLVVGINEPYTFGECTITEVEKE